MVVFQYVLAFILESWVVTPRILWELGILHNRVVQRISVPMARLQNGQCNYPPIGEALEDAGLGAIGVYITCRHNSVAQYIAPQSIF